MSSPRVFRGTNHGFGGPAPLLDASVVGGDFAPDKQATIRVRIGQEVGMDRGAIASIDLPVDEAVKLIQQLNELVATVRRQSRGHDGIAS